MRALTAFVFRTCVPLGGALLMAAALAPPTAGQIRDPGLLGVMKARSIGPAGMSGRITTIDAVESDPDVVYVGSATGGLWKSSNGGQTWRALFDDQPVLGIGAVAVFQADPSVVWVGTGEGTPRNSAGVGAGVYRSSDGGASWSLMGLEESERISRIVLDPADPDLAYVGVLGPAWSDGEERGVFRTRDGGRSWERVLFVDQRTGVSDLVMDPGNPRRLLAGMWEFRRSPWFFQSGGPGSGLYLSEDGGDTWTRLSEADGLPAGELGRTGLAISRSDPQAVYALVEARPSALLRSDDGGHHWRVVNDGEGVAPRPFYYARIVAAPWEPELIFNLHIRVARSTDGGESFEVVGSNVHSDAHALWLDPSGSGLAYLGTDGGVYISRDEGDHWRLVENLPLSQFYHVSVDMAVPFNVYGGMQDNGSWRGPSDSWNRGGIGNDRWEEVGTGDGFQTMVDAVDSTYGYSLAQGGRLVRFDLRTGERKDVRPWAPEGVELRFNWNAPLAADPMQPGTIYLGSQFVHRSDDRGETWQIISGDLTSNDPVKQRQAQSGGITRDHTGAENHTTLVSIAPSPVEPEVIWTGSDDGRVHLTRSSGGEWEDVGSRIRGVPEGSWIPHVEASKHAGSTAYVVFDDHRRGNWKPYIYRTEDYGRHWEDIADERQIHGFIHTVEEDPVTPNLLFAGTEFGLYVSLNSGRDWFPWWSGLPAVPVRSLVIHPRDQDLVIGTHGRGVYVLDDIRPLRALAEDPSLLDQPVPLFQPPPAYLRSEAAPSGYHFTGDAMFGGESRAPGATLTFSLPPDAGAVRATLQIVDDSGTVLRTLEFPAGVGLNRVVWDLREAPPAGSQEMASGFGSQGLEVLPGHYRVTVVANGGASSGELEVRGDPSRDISMADRIEKQNALRKGMGLSVVFAALQSRSLALSRDLNRATVSLGSRGGEPPVGVLAMVDSLRESLGPIQDAVEDLDGLRSVVASMTTSRDGPTESQHIALLRMEERLTRTVTRFNALLSTGVEDLRIAMGALGLDPFPLLEPVPAWIGDGGG